MSDLRETIQQQLDEARKLRLQIEAEKQRTKAELTRRLEQIDVTFAPRLDGATKAVEAFEGILRTFSSGDELAQAPTLIRHSSLEMRPAVKRIFDDSRGAHLHLDEVVQRVKSLGVETNAKDFSEAVRAAIYGLIEKGEPITRVAERTWAQQSVTSRHAGAVI